MERGFLQHHRDNHGGIVPTHLARGIVPTAMTQDNHGGLSLPFGLRRITQDAVRVAWRRPPPGR